LIGNFIAAVPIKQWNWRDIAAVAFQSRFLAKSLKMLWHKRPICPDTVAHGPSAHPALRIQFSFLGDAEMVQESVNAQ
jgi:hypothetical protein